MPDGKDTKEEEFIVRKAELRKLGNDELECL